MTIGDAICYHVMNGDGRENTLSKGDSPHLREKFALPGLHSVLNLVYASLEGVFGVSW